MDVHHAATLDHLTHNYGELPYTIEDGRQTTFKQMADEMQAQRNEAETFAKLPEVAGACAAAHA